MIKKRKALAACLALLILLQLFAGCNGEAPPNDIGSSENNNAPSDPTGGDENNNAPSDPTGGDENNNNSPSDNTNTGTVLSGVTFYDYANDWVGEEFMQENRVFFAQYPNGESEDDYFYELYEPRTKTFIATTEEEYHNLLPSDPIDVDFEKEMVILYISATAYPRKKRKHYLKKAELCEGVLTVTIEPEPMPEGTVDYGGTYPRCFALKMEKAEITEVIFKGIVIVYPPWDYPPWE